MKKIFSFLTVLLILIGAATGHTEPNPISPASEVAPKGASKDAVKAAKAQAKELKKQGWEVEGATTIENGFITIAEKQAAGYELLIGTSYGSQKSNVAKTKARNNAMNEFAEYGKSIIKGRINTQVDDIDEVEVDNLVSGYERLLIRELDNIMPQPTLVLRSKASDGKFACQCYYLINSSTLRNAQKKAIEEAIDNSEMAAKYGKSISDFVNSGFNEE